MTKKLNNLLNFKEYDNKDSFVLKGKPTKRTESGLDVIQEHHIEDRDEQLEFILDNIEDLDDETIEKIYKKVENGMDIEDDEDFDDEDMDDEDFDMTGPDEDDEDFDMDDEDFDLDNEEESFDDENEEDLDDEEFDDDESFKKSRRIKKNRIDEE